MLELINDTLHWLNAHPGWAGLLVFAIALGESLFIVGLFILGTPIMLGFGVLIAFGALELWSTLFWAALGTILGDGISFWLGYYYHDKIRNIWPFTRHPDWLERGEQLIERHGAKSVIFGRLIGATRSFIPITVGMVGMNPLRFHTLDFFATLIWAPSHIFPGVLLGASLTILMDVGTRLTLLVVGVPALIWLSVWIIHQGYRLLVPHTNQFINILLRWSHKNRFFRNLTSGILDPNHPHIIAMLEMGLVLLLATWLLLTLLAFNLSGSTPLEIDSQVYYLFKNLRVPWADPFPIIFNALNSGYSNLAVVLAGLSWLAWKRHWHGVGYWLGSLFFGLLTAWALYQILPLSSPSLHLLTEADTPANGFLESQIMLSTIIYGFIAVLLVRCLPVHLRWRPYAIASSWMLLLILSRLYLAQQWLSDALLGLALGLFWVTVMGLAYRQHHPSVLPLSWAGDFDFSRTICGGRCLRGAELS
ncbi:VTT domain-containing protein [Candidatus Venteria ishoeyi]|uniref:Inner membrane protein YabI n=1 Tax=Candidatus Venteria ishoeyi TaxID=1899563 RepID=A0A1H6FEM4_9GAMM|nr:VTT domain-containing protein [Candidatus Venteria ishoeyi]SEH07444.1 Inner membrane protein YabI [Candidatus Venteria ishoeyi]